MMHHDKETMLLEEKSTIKADIEPKGVEGEQQTSAALARSCQPCVICGQVETQEVLRAPDRFHGRQQKYSLVRCLNCSFVWLSDPPQPEEMYLHYTEAYHKLISAAGENSPGRWRSRVETARAYKQAGDILDLGCSSGGFLEFFYNQGWRLYGIEMSADCAKRAEERTGAKVFVGDILDASFSPQSFDVITCFDVLEHLYHPRQVLEKVKGWLKPDGIFYVQIPNIESAEARVFRSYWHGLELPRHLFHYSPESLKLLGQACGLRPLSITTERNSAVGTSLRYVFDDIFRTVGIRKRPIAYSGEASLPWKAARKLARLTVLRALLTMAALAGEGECIHGIFQPSTPIA